MTATTHESCPVHRSEQPFPHPRQGPFTVPATYAEMVEKGVVQVTLANTGLRVWAVTGYDRIRRLLADSRISASRKHDNFPFFFVPPPQARTETSFIGYDPPEHTAARRKVAAAFTRQRVRLLRPMIQRVIDEHIDRLLECEPPVDFHWNFSLSVPTTVICEYLGVPQNDHAFIIKHSNNLFGADSTPKERLAAIVEVNDYIADLVEHKEKEPGDDLTSAVIAEYRACGEEYSRRELVNMIRMLLNGGHETTASMISLGTACLLEHPDQLAELLADPEGLIEPAVEELVRLASIGDLAVPRVALEDIDIDGTVIPAGDGILCLLLTANHDPRVFPDPERLELRRGSRKQLGFGYGAHHCIGAELARLELQLVWTTLFRRIPSLRLVKPLAEVPRKEGAIVYGLWSLPVTWET
ncbi:MULTISPECIES: cytochrome P450 [Thermomonospora]|mgnify:CR=1 FL=1|uniref:Cytochrome P450 n=1 Tax=Thermomonospora curvata (strain ATCC 19995 / DSM 43183 / JCM 3096 / KCTC 9072 / NBRC 15933 / NCIMB 10081 / Henssen B9) TaxID=471852 RepID=D1A6S8_THECD|nr:MULTISPECIES: cytochrome P450 [Thermomonospora]ACY98332.1 cytochrome P450 [Thermomonospora curvata DSM 43183]PKK13497.1 MAG: cytochrome P450 [Thermomonospora sp. CIF 1]